MQQLMIQGVVEFVESLVVGAFGDNVTNRKYLYSGSVHTSVEDYSTLR